MAYQLVAFDTLAASIKLSIGSLIKHHKINANTEISEQVKLLPPDRRIQAQLLLKVIGILESTPTSAATSSKTSKIAKDNAYILNAMTYFVR